MLPTVLSGFPIVVAKFGGTERPTLLGRTLLRALGSVINFACEIRRPRSHVVLQNSTSEKTLNVRDLSQFVFVCVFP